MLSNHDIRSMLTSMCKIYVYICIKFVKTHRRARISVQVRELQVLYNILLLRQNLKSQGKKQVKLSIFYVGIKTSYLHYFRGLAKLFLKEQKVNILGFVHCAVQRQPKTTCNKWAWLVSIKFYKNRCPGAMVPPIQIRRAQG